MSADIIRSSTCKRSSCEVSIHWLILHRNLSRICTLPARDVSNKTIWDMLSIAYKNVKLKAFFIRHTCSFSKLYNKKPFDIIFWWMPKSVWNKTTRQCLKVLANQGILWHQKIGSPHFWRPLLVISGSALVWWHYQTLIKICVVYKIWLHPLPGILLEKGMPRKLVNFPPQFKMHVIENF